MSLATHTLTHVADGQANLLGFLRAKTKYMALAAVYLAEVQDLEDALWTLSTQRALNQSPVGVQLDGIGQIVGIARNGLGDSDYLNAINTQIALNTSNGLINDVIRVMLAMNASTSTTFKMYQAKCSFSVVASAPVVNPANQAATLRSATAAGVWSLLIAPYVSTATSFTLSPTSALVANAALGLGDSSLVGQSWTLYSSGAGIGINAVGTDGGLNFYAYPGGGSFIRQSTDGGITWAQGSVLVGNGWSSLAVYDGGLWGGVLIGTPGDGASIDGSVVGTNGSTQSFVGASAAFLGSVTSIAVGGGKIVVCGSDGVIGFFNGTTWADKSGNGGTNFKAAALTTNDYVVVGAGTACRWSTDGNTWTLSNTGLAGSNALAFGASLFVAGDAAGNIATSPTGQTWTGRTSNFGAFSITKIAFLNSLFVAIGANGKLCTSADGITWAARTSQFGTSAINDIAYTNGEYVIVGAGGKVATSPDGFTWTLQTSNIATVLNAIAANASTAAVASGTASQNVITSKPGVSGGRLASSY